MPGRIYRISSYFCFGLLLLICRTLANNTVCASNQLDWYTGVVGESPCTTYERLRRICNSDYEVPPFRSQTPGDNCDDQVVSCCCNTVAFQLSMLCMNCQEDPEAGNVIGWDAASGTYALYRGSCGAGTNHSLSPDIQTAVCSENIRLDNYLYDGWDDGSWFYIWTRENAERDHAANNNDTFTHCPDQISPTVTSTPLAISTAMPPTTSSETTLDGPTSSISNAPSNTGSTSNVSPQGAPPTNFPSTSSTTNSFATSLAVNIHSASSSDITVVPSTRTGPFDVSTTPVSAIASSSGGNGPTVSPVNDSTAGQTHPSSHLAAIIGGVVGGVAALGSVVGVLVCLRRRSRARRNGMIARRLSESPSDGDFCQTRRRYAAVADLTLGDGSTSNQDVRHTDAGILLPLDRSDSGRPPPAYHSWVEGSVIHIVGPGSGLMDSTMGNLGSVASEVVGSPRRLPFTAARLEEK